MDKKFWISGIVASLLFFLIGFLVHGVLLTEDYMRLKALMRPEAEAMANMPYMILAHVLMGFAFAWIYARGISGAPWVAQGLRFGVAVALLVIVPWYLIYYSIQPWPAATVAKQIIFDGIGMVITALAVAFINKDSSPAST
jgi:hypothetical protein